MGQQNPARLCIGAFPAHQIETYTFGSHGQLDYEIGKKVAKAARVEHTAFNLEKVSLKWDHLKGSTRKTPWTYTMDSFFNKYCYSEMQSGAGVILRSEERRVG